MTAVIIFHIVLRVYIKIAFLDLFAKHLILFGGFILSRRTVWYDGNLSSNLDHPLMLSLFDQLVGESSDKVISLIFSYTIKIF